VVLTNGRVFVAMDGFGMKPYLSGTALIGYYDGDAPSGRERVHAVADIDVRATEALARDESPNRMIRLRQFLESLGAVPGFIATATVAPVKYQPWVFPNGESVIVEYLHAGPGDVAGYEVYGRIERGGSIDATEAALRTLAGA
jgi:hypothetical protein